MYEPVLIGIDRSGRWYLFQGETADILGDSWCREEICIPVAASPDKGLHGILLLDGQGTKALPLVAAKDLGQGTRLSTVCEAP